MKGWLIISVWHADADSWEEFLPESHSSQSDVQIFNFGGRTIIQCYLEIVFMTYNRLKAKVIPGEHCRFCGEEFLPLVKTRCCDQWICCDTNFISIRGGGYCQFEHEHYSACYFHYNEGHQGSWKECKECREFFEEEQYNSELNFKLK